MKKIGCMLGVALLTAGCATAKLAAGPQVSSLTEYPSAVRVEIPAVADERGTNSAGMIGGCGIKVQSKELASMATNYVIDNVNRYLGANVTRPGAAAADYVMKVAITELKMHSIDAIMEPVETKCRLSVKLYDAAGQEILNRFPEGRYEERIGLSVVGSAAGRLAERAVKDAVANLVKEPELQSVFQTKP